MLASILATLTLAACSDTAADPGRLEPEKGLQSAAAIIEVAPAEAHIETAGQSVDLSVELRDKKGKPISGRLITWTSLQPSVARVENTGRVTALAKGEAVVLATADGLVDTARVFVRRDPPPAASIQIVQGNASIPAVGGSITLVADVRDESGESVSNAAVSWESLNVAVATVSSAGKVFGLTAGGALIVARYGSLSDTVEVAVGTGGGAAQIQIVPELAGVAIGETTPLSVTLRDANGGMLSVTGVTWESSNPVVASVNSSGVVTGNSAGVAQILAKHGSLEATSVVQVGGAGQPAQVLIGTESDTIPAIGATVSLTAVVLDSEGNEVPSAAVKWVSLDPTVAVVGEGSVAGVQKGIGRVAARHGALADTATLWVAPAPPTATPSALNIFPAVDTITSIGGQASLTAAVFDAQSQPISGKAIVWTSLDIAIAEVDANGVVTSGEKGVARIVATHGALADTSLVYVEPLEQHVEEDPGSGEESEPTFTVIVEPVNDTIPSIGATLLFEVLVLDGSGKIVPNAKANWKVLNSSIVSLSATSQVRTTNGTGKAAGTTRVVASYGTFADTVPVTVAKGASTIQPVGLRISPRADTIPNVGASTTLTVDVYDAQGNAIVNGKAAWASLDPSIVSVGTAGQTDTRVITGLAKGTARITATANGVSDTATVLVLGPTGSAPTISVTHSPDNPTTATTVTITATASDPAAVASMTISLDGTTVKSCTGGTCSYSGQLAAGPHTYSASAIDVSGNTLNAGPVNFTVWLAPSGGGGGGGSSTYSPTSPHWRHMRTSTIDYRIHYQGTRSSAEWDWAAAHYDLVVGGRVGEYKKRNPTVRQMVYDLLWAPLQTNSPAMEQWLQSNGFNPENAYLHKSGGAKSKATRLTANIWNSDRYIANPGDPGYAAWRKHRTQSLMGGNSGFQSDGLFFDEFGSGGIGKHVPSITLEYGSSSAYRQDLNALLSQHRQWVPGGFNIVNQANYFNKPPDMASSAASGATMTEFQNTPYGQERWSVIDALVAKGVTVEFATGVASSRKNIPSYDMNRGMYGSVAERVLMWEYASYLMVVDPNRMDSILFETYGLSWSVPMDATWLKAFEHDIGLAQAKRKLVASGKDGTGQDYAVWSRDFENGVVLIRPRQGSATKFGDQTAVNVPVPAGVWKLLQPDGSVLGPVTSLKLRNGESAILVK